MTIQQTETVLNKLNVTYDGKALRTDRDGNVLMSTVDFLHGEIFKDMSQSEAEKLVNKVIFRYDVFPRGANLLKMFRDNSGYSSYSGNEFRLTAKQLFDDLNWYNEIKNTTGLSDIELFNKLESDINEMLEKYPAKQVNGYHYLNCSPNYKQLVNNLIERLNIQPRDVQPLDSKPEKNQSRLDNFL